MTREPGAMAMRVVADPGLMPGRAGRIMRLVGLLLLAAAAPAQAAVRTWDGGGTDGACGGAAGDGNKWSCAANWSDDTLPSGSDDVVFNATNTKNCAINSLPTVPASISLNAGYTGTVTIKTGFRADKTIALAGNLTINDGAMVAEAQSLTGNGEGVTITAANVTIAANKSLNADGQGFAVEQGPGAGESGSEAAGTHGGVGSKRGTGAGANADATYGSLTNPTSLGSGGDEGAGGGAITLSATGTITVNGTLSANGTDTSFRAGAGGSINLTAATLTGTGTIRANGGASTNTDAAGGGGRISLGGVTTDTFSGTLQANGGTGGRPGYAGTIYLNAAKRSSLTLGGGGNLASLRLGADGTNNYTLGAVTIQTGGTLELDGNPNMNSNQGGAATLSVSSLDVQAGGLLSADGLGFGGTITGSNYGAGPASGGGNVKAATHGGVGGSNDAGIGANEAATYGSLANPINLGSGADGAGGGTLIVSATGTITVNGTLSANGVNSTYSASAGGSINLTAATLTGTGTIRANGGGTGNYGGGGGRISLNGVTTDTFTGTLQANGGASAGSRRGYAGTIYLNAAKRTSLTLGGGGNLASLRLGADGTNNYTLGAVIIQTGGTLELDGNPNMNAGYGGAATLNVTTLDVQTGGLLSADGLGFSAAISGQGGTGPAGGVSGGEGGTHAGEGGGNADATYGSLTNPVHLGSSGGDNPGAGAILISASGAVTVNGTISANGATSTNSAGAGGAINMKGSTLSGSGTVRANGGGGGNGSGGGGRVAVALTSGASFGSVAFQAYGGATGTVAAAGSVYLEDANDGAGKGELKIDNNATATAAGTDTLISASVNAIVLRPTGAGFYANWDTQNPASGAHWDKLDEVAMDGDTTFIETPTNGASEIDTFTHAASGLSATAPIERVSVAMVAHAIAPWTGADLRFVLKISNTNYFSATKTLTSGQNATYSHSWTTSPATGSAWTTAELDALEFGVIRDAGTGGPIRITQVWLEVTQPRRVGAVTLANAAKLAIPAGETLATIADGTTLTINAATTLTNNGALSLSGSAFTNSGTWTNAAGSLVTYTGQADQADVTIYAMTYDDLTINGAGTIFFSPTSGLTVNDALTVTAGQLRQTTGSITTGTGAFTIAASGAYINLSTGDLNVGAGGVANSGQITLDGSGGGCGGTDEIIVESTAAPTDQTWSGSGSFTMYDVDVRNQTKSATPAITVYSSAFTSMGANWTLDGGCPAGIVWNGLGVDGTCGGAGTANNWSCGANWTGGTPPNNTQVAVFDATSTKSATINANIDVDGIRIDAGYTGTITQANGVTIQLRYSGYVQYAGTFTGSNAAITVGYAGSFALWDGTFNATSGTLSANGHWTVSGGTFSPDSGTVFFGDAAATITGSHALNNVTFAEDILAGGYTVWTIASGTTLTVNGTLRLQHSTGLLLSIATGTIAAKGPITVADSGNCDGSATILINGTGDQTFTGNATMSSGQLPNIEINKPSGTLTLAGTIRTGRNWTYTQGTLSTAGSTVVFGDTSTGTIIGSHALNNVTFSEDDASAYTLWTIASGTTLTVNGTLRFQRSTTNTLRVQTGTLAAKGPITVADTGDYDGTATILINGTGDQTFSGSATASAGSLPNIQINKPSGTLTLAGTIRTGRHWTYTQGALSTAGSTVVFGDGNWGDGITITGSHALNHVTFSDDNASAYSVWTIAAGTTLTVAGNLTMTSPTGVAALYVQTGMLAVQGHITTDTPIQGSAAIMLTGSGNQTLDINTFPTGTFTVNKSGGTATLVRALSLNGSGQDLTITSGALSLAGFALTVNDALTVGASGTLQWFGSETITRGSLTLASGSTVKYTGNGNSGANAYTITSFTPNYHHLTISSTDGALDTFQTDAPLDVNGNLTVTAGTFHVNNGANGITVGGNWSSSGTFTGTVNVTLDGSDQSISGSATFNNLTKTASASATLTFANTGTQTITGALTLQGVNAGVRMLLRSDSAGQQWELDPQGSRTCQYLDVQDSNNLHTTNITCTSCKNSNNNTRWTFNNPLTQKDFRFYQNLDALQPTSPLGGENAAPSLAAAAMRLRMSVSAVGQALNAASQAFRLQWATNSAGPWTELGSGWKDSTGADGSVTISTAKNINTDILGSSRAGNPDGIVTAVTANPTGTAITVANSAGFAAGDEILLMNLRGTATDNADAGNYEFLTVASVPNGTTLNLTEGVAKSYDGTSFANQKVVVQRVPQWTSVTINTGGSLTASDWDGTKGGLLVFRASGAVTINSGGSLHVNGKGFRGGDGPDTGSDVNGFAGESYSGLGAQSAGNNAGGGGGGAVNLPSGDSCGEAGAGGGYGAAGTMSANNGYGTSCVPNTPVNTVGSAHGVADLSKLYLGSGGGGGGNDAHSAGASGDGGAGGGVIMISANSISVSGVLEAKGADGQAAPDWGDNGSGGGGSGGSILLQAQSVTLAANVATAAGGTGGGSANTQWNAPGGNGGAGRIRIESDAISGATTPAASTAGTPGGGAATSWKPLNNASVADGTTVSAVLLSASDVAESYEEANPTVANPNAIAAGQEGEWDFALDGTAVSTGTYYFRMVKDDGIVLDDYTTYPQVTITSGATGPAIQLQGLRMEGLRVN